MIACQRELFDIPDEVVWLACAQHSPALNSVYAAGLAGLENKRHPWTLGAPHYWDNVERVRGLFARLIGAGAEDIAIVPSVSYGISLAAGNLTVGPDRSVVVLEEQFPSNVYPWRDLTDREGGSLVTVARPAAGHWTEGVLAAIDRRTAVVALPQCHWMDGAMIDLSAVGAAARGVGAALVLDLTQSLGALPFDLAAVAPDYIVAGAYKWLLGPYNFGFLYAAPERQSGRPLEQGWVTRAGSDRHHDLTDYRDEFLPGARRFDVGERGNYIAVPMATAALEQILDWGVPAIAESLRPLVEETAERAAALGLRPTPVAGRAPHFLGLRLAEGPPSGLAERLLAERIYVSLRGDCLRVAPHLYNRPADIERLFAVLKAAL